jgi:hypothetical protein
VAGLCRAQHPGQRQAHSPIASRGRERDPCDHAGVASRCNADDATDALCSKPSSLRIVYDKAIDRLSISATLTEAVAAMLRTGLQPLCNRLLWGTDSHNCTTVTHEYPLGQELAWLSQLCCHPGWHGGGPTP